MNKQILAIDCGTQSVRAVIFDLAGKQCGVGRSLLANVTQSDQRQRLITAEVIWQATLDACQQALAQTDPSAVAAVTVTTQRASSVLLDADGNALAPVAQWTHCEQEIHTPKLPWWLRLGKKLPRVQQLLTELQQRAPVNQYFALHPEAWQKAEKILLLSGYVNYRLTGQWVDCSAAQVGYLPFDFKRQTWKKPSHWYWRALKILPRHLPELVPAATEIGRLSTPVASQLGLKAPIPVVACAGDKACEALGAGILSDSTLGLSFGTAASVSRLTPKFQHVRPLLPAYPAAATDWYALEIQLDRGFWQVSWLLEQFGLQQADRSVPEGVLDHWLNSTPPGADGLLSIPHWNYSITHPSAVRRGALIGLNETHQRPHIYRALIEGILFALKHGASHLDRRLGQPAEKIVAAGGGAASDAVLQLSANIFNHPVEQAATPEASALGAAITAAVGLGLFEDFPTAVAAMVGQGRCYHPEPEAAQQLAEQYRHYRRCEKRLLGLSEYLENT